MLKEFVKSMFLGDTKRPPKLSESFVSPHFPFEYVISYCSGKYYGYDYHINMMYRGEFKIEIFWDVTNKWSILIDGLSYSGRYQSFNHELKYIVDFFCWLAEEEHKKHRCRSTLSKITKEEKVLGYAIDQIKKIESDYNFS